MDFWNDYLKQLNPTAASLSDKPAEQYMPVSDQKSVSASPSSTDPYTALLQKLGIASYNKDAVDPGYLIPSFQYGSNAPIDVFTWGDTKTDPYAAIYKSLYDKFDGDVGAVKWAIDHINKPEVKQSVVSPGATGLSQLIKYKNDYNNYSGKNLGDQAKEVIAGLYKDNPNLFSDIVNMSPLGSWNLRDRYWTKDPLDKIVNSLQRNSWTPYAAGADEFGVSSAPLNSGLVATTIDKQKLYDYNMSQLLQGKDISLDQYVAGNYRENEMFGGPTGAGPAAKEASVLYGSKSNGELLKTLGSRLGLTEDEVDRVAGVVAANRYGDAYAKKTNAPGYGGEFKSSDWTNALFDYAESKGIAVPAQYKTVANDQNKKIDDYFGQMRGIEEHTGGMLDGFGPIAAFLGPILQFTPLAPLGTAISLISAVESGNPLSIVSSIIGLGNMTGAFDGLSAASSIGDAAETVGSIGDIAGAADVGSLANNLSGASDAVSTVGNLGSITSTAQNGLLGSIGDAFRSADNVLKNLLPNLGSDTANQLLNSFVKNAVKEGISSQISGRDFDITNAITATAVGGVADAYKGEINEALKSISDDKAIQQAIKSAVTTGAGYILNGVVKGNTDNLLENAATAALLSGGTGYIAGSGGVINNLMPADSQIDQDTANAIDSAILGGTKSAMLGGDVLTGALSSGTNSLINTGLNATTGQSGGLLSSAENNLTSGDNTTTTGQVIVDNSSIPDPYTSNLSNGSDVDTTGQTVVDNTGEVSDPYTQTLTGGLLNSNAAGSGTLSSGSADQGVAVNTGIDQTTDGSNAANGTTLTGNETGAETQSPGISIDTGIVDGTGESNASTGATITGNETGTEPQSPGIAVNTGISTDSNAANGTTLTGNETGTNPQSPGVAVDTGIDNSGVTTVGPTTVDNTSVPDPYTSNLSDQNGTDTTTTGTVDVGTGSAGSGSSISSGATGATSGGSSSGTGSTTQTQTTTPGLLYSAQPFQKIDDRWGVNSSIADLTANAATAAQQASSALNIWR